MHFADQRHGVGDALVPAGLAPGVLAALLAVLQRLVTCGRRANVSRHCPLPAAPSLTPDVMDVVQPADLGEEPGERLVVLLTEADRARPVVAPLDHRARLQPVRAHLVDVVRVARQDLRPVAEREHVLQVPRPQQQAALVFQRLIILRIDERDQFKVGQSATGAREHLIGFELSARLVDSGEAAGVAPNVDHLVQIADLHRP